VAPTLQVRPVMRNRTVLLTTLGIALSFTLTAGLDVAWVAQAQDRAVVTTGTRLFKEHGCYGCHRIGALGTPIGPDLSRVGAKYVEADLVRWLSDPASQKPNAHMPKLELTPAEVKALAAFLATQR
jgi:mono/diheme cytochrome c family protein